MISYESELTLKNCHMQLSLLRMKMGEMYRAQAKNISQRFSKRIQGITSFVNSP